MREVSPKVLLEKEWRLKNLYKIKPKPTGKGAESLIPFRRNRAQIHFAQNKANRNIILKSRQLGFTTDEAIDSLDDTLFTANFDSLLIAHSKEEALKIFDKKIDVAWKNFNGELKQRWKVDTNRANTLKFDFGDGTASSIAVAISGRSGTYNRVHISEFGKMCRMSPQSAQEVITGTIPSVPLHGRIDIESTAEGEFGEFYEMFWEAWDRRHLPKLPTQFKAHFYDWTWDDEILKVTPANIISAMAELPQEFKDIQAKFGYNEQQITFYYFQWLALGRNWKSLRQEYPCTPEEAFQGSLNKLFDMDSVGRQSQFIMEPTEENGWKIFDKPRPGHNYGIGADPSEGIGKDSAAAVVWDFSRIRPKVVATFHSNTCEPDVFGYELKGIATRYNLAMVGVERNNTGLTTLTTLKGIYPINKIYKEQKFGNIDKHQTERLGWLTNLSTKPKMLAEIKTAVDEDAVEIPSAEILREMRTYDRTDVSRIRGMAGEPTQHWDLVIAAAIGYQMRLESQDKVVRVMPDTSNSDPFNGV